MRRPRPRPTRGGALVALLAGAAGVAGWLLGQPELTAVGVMAAAALVAAAWWVVAAPTGTDVGRILLPPRVRAGEDVLVQLRISNRSTRRAPIQRCSERAGSSGSIDLAVAPIPAGSSRELTYRYPARTRGIHRLGPATITIEDPFGLVRASYRCGEDSHLVVLPRTWRLPPIPGAVGGHTMERRARLPSRSTHDDDVASLRTYEPGDDLRRVHWRTSARQGRLVVRQYDPPWTRRTTIVLDVRAACHDDASFERAVAAAASLVEHADVHGELVRLLTTDGTDSGVVGSDGVDALLDQLAAVERRATGSLAETLDRLRPNPDGRLVVCTGALEAAGHALVTGSTRSWSRRHLVTTGRCTPSAESDPPALVVWTAGSFADAWTAGAPEPGAREPGARETAAR